MKRFGPIGIMIAVFAVIGLAAWIFRPQQPRRDEGLGKAYAPNGREESGTNSEPLPTIQNPKSKIQNPISPSVSFSILGSVVAPIQATLSTRAPSRIIQVFAREGDPVRKGQLLVLLDDSERHAQEISAIASVNSANTLVSKALTGRKAQLVKADADIQAAKNGARQANGQYEKAKFGMLAAQSEQKTELIFAEQAIRKAASGYDQAKKTLRSLEELSKIGGVARSDLEAAQTLVTNSKADLESAQAQKQRLLDGAQEGKSFRIELAEKDAEAAKLTLELANLGIITAGFAKSQLIAVADKDVQSAKDVLKQAQTGLDSARAAREQNRLLSPISGVISNVVARAGEVAQPGTALVNVISLEGMRIEALVLTRQLRGIHIGQQAKISLDTLPGKVFTSIITEISRFAEPDGRSFRVKFRILDPPYLHPGQTARISLQQ